jgi:hypothetical protein
MRYREIVRRPATTDSHPFVTDINTDPAAFDDFERVMKDREDVRLLARIDGPDRSLAHLGCSTERVRRTFNMAGEITALAGSNTNGVRGAICMMRPVRGSPETQYLAPDRPF